MSAATKVTFTPDWTAVRTLSHRSGPIGRAVDNAADATVARAKRLSPVKTGRLRTSIKRTPAKVSDSGVSFGVYADTPYAAAVHNGGGRGRRRPQPFLTDALRQLSANDFRD